MWFEKTCILFFLFISFFCSPKSIFNFYLPRSYEDLIWLINLELFPLQWETSTSVYGWSKKQTNMEIMDEFITFRWNRSGWLTQTSLGSVYDDDE